MYRVVLDSASSPNDMTGPSNATARSVSARFRFELLVSQAENRYHSFIAESQDYLDSSH